MYSDMMTARSSFLDWRLSVDCVSDRAVLIFRKTASGQKPAIQDIFVTAYIKSDLTHSEMFKSRQPIGRLQRWRGVAFDLASRDQSNEMRKHV